MPLVAGVDSSTQSVKVVVRDARPAPSCVRGERRIRTAPSARRRPGGTRCRSRAPAGSSTASRRWRSPASSTAWSRSTATGEVVRPALLWNDTRSAPDADDLVAELGGPAAWAAAVGSVPVASFTVTKLRWLARAEPEQRRAGRPGAAPARLADLAAGRSAGDADHRPWRRIGHRLLVAGAPASTGDDLLELALGRRGRGPASRRAGRAGRPDGRRGAARPGHRRQHGRGAGPRARGGRRRGLARDVRDRLRGRRGQPRADASGPWPASPTRPGGSCRWSRRSTPRGC